jgi:hypoxia up-regulated 1
VSTEEYRNKAQKLEDRLKEMKMRQKEYEQFPGYIASLNAFVTNITAQLAALRKDKPWIANATLQPFVAKLEELVGWTANRTQERKELPATSEPVLTQKLVDAKMSAIRALLRELRRIPKPKVAVANNGTCPAVRSTNPIDDWFTCSKNSSSLITLKEDL